MKGKFCYLWICVLLVLGLPAVSFAAVSITGTVTQGATGGPISGVLVQLNTGQFVTTAANGVYAFNDLVTGTYTLYASHSSYYTRVITVTVTVGTTTTQNINLVPIPANADPTYDDFNRADTAINGSAALGTTSGAETRTWTRLDGSAYCGITSGRLALTLPSNATNYSGVGLSTAFTASDFDATVDLSMNGAGASDIPQILWRQSQYAQGSFMWNGFVLRMASNGSSISMRLYPGGTTANFIKDYVPATPINWTQPHTLRVRAVGYRHTIWLDGEQIIDALVYTWTGSGYFGFSQWGPANAAKITSYWDNFSIAKVVPPAGSITGRVYDLNNPSVGVAGAVVKPSVGTSVTTDADGNYTLANVNANFPISLTILHDDYFYKSVTPVMAMPDVPTVVDVAMVHLPIPNLADIVFDDFTRVNGTDLGTTEDDNHYPWEKGRDELWSSITDERLQLGDTGATAYAGGVSVGGDFLPADFDMTVDVYVNNTQSSGTPGWPCAVGYRQQKPGAYANNNGQDTNQSGYLVYIPNAGNQVILYRNSSPALQTVNANPALDMANNAKHTIRVKAVGNHHEAWVDGVKYIDYYGTQKLTGGYLGLYHYKNQAQWDNLRITRYPLNGVISGTVADIANPSIKIAGATVKLSSGGTTTTDANGYYSFTGLANGTYAVSAYSDSYYAKSYGGIAVTQEQPAVRDFKLAQIPQQSDMVTDDFERDTGVDLGTTTDAHHYPWDNTGDVGTVWAAGGVLYFWPMPSHGVSIGGGFLPADVDISVFMSIIGDNTTSGGISYRQPKPGQYNYANGNGQSYSGYTVYASGDGSKIALWRNGADLISVPVSGKNWASGHVLRVRATGIRHEVWVDGTKYIDLIDAGNAGGGYVSITRNNAEIIADNLSVAVYDPGAASTLRGVVYDRDNPNIKLAGASMRLSDGQILTADSNGEFTTTINAGLIYSLTAVAPGYAAVSYSGIEPVTGQAYMQNIAMIKQPANRVVWDTFTRADGAALGSTEDPLHCPWGKATTDPKATIASGTLKFASGVQGWGVGINSTAFLPADVDITVDVYAPNITDVQWVGVMYRQSYIGDMNWGYHAYIWGPGKDTASITNWGNGGGSAGGSLPNAPVDWSVPHKVRVKAVGPRHQLYFDGVLVVDYYDWGKVTGGYVNFTRWNCEAYFDNLFVMGYNVIESAAVNDVAAAKQKADGTVVNFSGPIVTGVFDGFFYVEDTLRTAGIKIVSNKAIEVGDAVTVDGMVSSVDGEKYIAAREVTVISSDNTIEPLGMPNKSNVPAVGLSNLGLLTRVWGTVTGPDVPDTFFMVDDGSGTPVKVMVNGTAKPAKGDYVTCTGIARMLAGPAPVLQMRNDNDLWIKP